MKAATAKANPDSETDAPIDIGNVYRWQLFGWILVDGMYIDEDGNCQVRVIDRSERRTVDAETIHNLVAGKGIELVGKKDDYIDEPWTEEPIR